MNRKDTFEWTIDHNDEELDVLVTYLQTSNGYAGSGPSWNHPGDPPEAPEIELLEVARLDTGEVLALSSNTEQKLYEDIIQRIGEREYEDYPEWD